MEDRPLRILHLLNHSYRLNGNVHAAIDLACEQAKMGHDVSLCSSGGSFDEILGRAGVRVTVLQQERSVVAAVSAIIKLFVLFRRLKPDLVHCHMMTCVLYSLPACLILRVPLITTVHNAFQRSSIIMGLGSRVIAVSSAVRGIMRRKFIPASRIRVILNGTIGSVRFDSAYSKATLVGNPVVLYVGGLHPRKGVGDLIAAFADYVKMEGAAQLYLVGEGPFQAIYEAMALNYGLSSSVHFVGALEDPRPLLSAADIFVLPSHADPAPLVLSEAREAGCAIVATNVDGIPEMLDNGNAGMLIEPMRPDQLSRALQELSFSKSLLEEWRLKSRRNISHLSIRRVAIETEVVYRECL